MIPERFNSQDLPLMFTSIQGKEYIIRYLEASDYEKGFPELLSFLTVVGDIDKEKFDSIFQEIQNQGCSHILVVEDIDGRVVASGKLLVEPKFFRNCRAVGHIEDIVTHVDHRGNGIARELLRLLELRARGLKCYKLILDCEPDLKKMYEKSGYQEKSIQMRLDL
eukprot:GHVR01046979.1.p1 GENE.GHVR01046979.1~~GHVR01046979.1.p1  ORF type:complete len:165 (+),score=7.05 GHVR01046979.1:40-534(+)